MIDGRIFDGMISALLIIGAVIGVAIVGLGWLIFWLASHITIGWV